MNPALGMAVLSALPWREAADRAVAHGYRCVDLQLDSDSTFTQSVLADGVGRMAQYLRRQGLRIACLSNVRDAELLLGPHTRHTDALCPGDAHAKARHAARWARRTIGWAEQLDVPLVRLYFGCSDPLLMFPWHGHPRTWQTNVDAFVADTAEILGFAAARGVVVCVESHPRQALFRVSALEAARRALAAEGLRLGLCFDPANILAGGLDPIGYLEALPGPPEVVHVKDAEVWHASTEPPGPGWRSYGPGALSRFRDFGRGGVDWPRIGALLARKGFTGVCVAEFEDPTVTAAAALSRSTAQIQGWVTEHGW